MTELGHRVWRETATINWPRLFRAYNFYVEKGYRYLEVPWAVSREIVECTIPPGATPIRLRASDATLIGSAEQGFLDVAMSKGWSLQEGERYFSISPCFRGEEKTLEGHTQLSFMKLELFAPVGDFQNEEDLTERLVKDARQFMKAEGAKVTVRPVNDLCCDLDLNGIEVGSYGSRSVETLTWAYGTGLAEPRFSFALKGPLL